MQMLIAMLLLYNQLIHISELRLTQDGSKVLNKRCVNFGIYSAHISFILKSYPDREEINSRHIQEYVAAMSIQCNHMGQPLLLIPFLEFAQSDSL